MRTLSDTLLKAQKAVTVNALAKIVLTYGANTYTYTKPRILDIDETGNGSLQSCKITLDNSDGVLTALDLKGYKGVLSFGAITSAGEEYSACAPMWVLAQEFNSDPNKLECTLSLVGICNLMAQDEASVVYQPDDTDTKSVKTLVNEIVEKSLACLSHCTAYQVVWDDGYDELADTYIPKDAFRIYPGNNRLSAINRLLEYTTNVAVVKADGKIHIFKPTTSGETYDYQYSLESGHPFFSKALRNRLTIPNCVKVYSREDDDPGYSGYATDAESYAKLPKVKFKFTYLESNDQAEDIAEAMLARAQMWCEAGAANVPLNVGAEVFDYVKVTDEREEDYRVGNIGKYVRHYNVTKNEWRMTFVFGNWQNVRKALADLGITSDDLENYFSRLSVGDLYVENLLAKNMGFYWIDPDNTIDLSKIGDNLDNLPDGEQYARVSTWNMKLDEDPESPTYGLFILNLDEHTAYQPGYDPTTKRRNFTAEPTTPYDLGDMWTDGTVLKRCITARATGAYQAGDWAQVSVDEIGDGATYQRTKSAALTAEGLVVLDSTVEGTFGLIKSTDISAGHIRLDTVVTGTYGLVKSTDISAGHIKLSTVEQTTDYRTVTDTLKGEWNNKAEPDLANVPYIYRLRTTQISSGYIKLTSASYKVGEWYEESGIILDADNGLEVHGTVAKWFTDADVYRGCVVAEGGDFFLWSNGNLLLNTGEGGSGNIILRPETYIRPYVNNHDYLGTSSYYWARVYANTYYGKTTTIQSFQSHDDIALLRSIQHKKGKLDVDTFPVELTETDEEVEEAYQDALNKLAEEEEVLEKEKRGLEERKKAIEADQTLEKEPKQKQLKEIKRRQQDVDTYINKFKTNKPKILKSLEDGKVRGVNMLDWQSLLMGSIVQLADKVEALETKLAGNK